MIRTALFRAFVLLAALAGALTPVRSFCEDGDQLPEKATRITGKGNKGAVT